MVKYFESKTIFHYTWEQVTQGFWSRYPNPESKHVLSEDTVSREIRGTQLFTKRLLTKTNRVPKWGERFVSTPIVKIVEESIVDPKQKTLVTYTRNLGYNKVMSIVEKVVYKVSDENPEWTVAERSAWIDSQVIGFGRAIQAFGIERFKKNCFKMIRGFDYVLANMFPTPISPNNSASSDQHTLLSKDKIKDAAKMASKLAKAKAETFMGQKETS